MPRSDEDDFRWSRIGHINLGRFCDLVAVRAYELLPGNDMPARWRRGTPEDLVRLYGEGILWSRTANYHLLIINGHLAARFWTRTQRANTRVDAPEHILKQLDDALVIPIDAGSLKKCAPFNHFVYLHEVDEVDVLVQHIKSIYGLDT